jgi:hypothetical protein
VFFASGRVPFAVKSGFGKIRQQLQVLRDTGFLTHLERGVWMVK